MEENILSCPIYNKNLDDMIKKKTDAKTDTDKLKILMEFADRHTMLPDQQTELLRLLKQCKKNLPKELNNCLYSTYYGDKNVKHIDWSNHLNIICNLREAKLPDRFQVAEDALTFPHQRLDEIYQNYLYYSVKPVTKEIESQYKQSEMLYDKIIKCENDIDKWLECIKQIENKRAVIANLELKLGQNSNWKNKKIWKFYFRFLKENNMKEILEVFQKYTRLFICDKQAVKQYLNEIEKFSSQNMPASKYMIDTIKYEMDFGKLSSAYRMFKQVIKANSGKPYLFVIEDKNNILEKLKDFETEMVKNQKLRLSSQMFQTKSQMSVKPSVYYRNPQQQQFFCFHQSFIQNLLKNAEGRILRKLYAACRFFFYSKKKAPLCYRLEICGNKKTGYYQEALYVNKKEINFAGLNDLHLYHGVISRVNSNRNLLSRVIPKFKLCEVNYMDIVYQNLTIPEYKFLLSKKIYQIMMYDVNICNDKNGSIIDAKELLKILGDYPSLKYLSFVNQNLCIVAYYYGDGIFHNRIPSVGNFRFKSIYMAKHVCSASKLQAVISYDETKFITLYKSVVDDENGNKMNEQQLRDFILPKVNPANIVSVNIVEIL